MLLALAIVSSRRARRATVVKAKAVSIETLGTRLATFESIDYSGVLQPNEEERADQAARKATDSRSFHDSALASDREHQRTQRSNDAPRTHPRRRARGHITLAVSAPGAGAAPDHETFTFSADSIDTSCGFPVAVHAEFTNMIIDSSLLSGTGTLQLHQSDVETWTANGSTLRVNDHYTIFVTTVDGVPQTATHVGVLDDIVGPNGDHLFFRTGQAVYQVVFDPDFGFYVDGALLTPRRPRQFRRRQDLRRLRLTRAISGGAQSVARHTTAPAEDLHAP